MVYNIKVTHTAPTFAQFAEWGVEQAYPTFYINITFYNEEEEISFKVKIEGHYYCCGSRNFEDIKMELTSYKNNNMSKAITNMNILLANSNNAYDIVYLGIKHLHKQKAAHMVESLGINTLKQFLKYDFTNIEASFAVRLELTNLQDKIIKHLDKEPKPTKVIAKRKATKPAKKKAVAKKKPTMADKVRNQYKIVSNWSDSLMQDVYSVVYRTNTLKRFVNENLANKYIEQEVLIRSNEKALTTAKKSRAVAKELEAEFA